MDIQDADKMKASETEGIWTVHVMCKKTRAIIGSAKLLEMPLMRSKYHTYSQHRVPVDNSWPLLEF